MESGIVTTQNYPIGDLYLMFRAAAAQSEPTKVPPDPSSSSTPSPFSTEFVNRRALLLSLGVPECRIRSVTAQLVTSRRKCELIGIQSDLDRDPGVIKPLAD